MELGITTFAEVTEAGVSPGERLRQVVEEAVLAEQVGLSVYGVGEHHRPDMAASAPAVVLATIAGPHGTHPAQQRGDGAQLGGPRPGVPGLRHPRPALLRPGRADGRARVVHRVVPAVRLLPRRLRRPVRGEARAAARAARRGADDLVGAVPGAAGRASSCTRGPSGRCPSGSRSAAPRSRSSAPARSGCRWRWRSSAGSGPRSPRTPTSTAARSSTARPTRPRRSRCTATATSASTRRPGGPSSCPRTGRRSTGSGASAAGRPCRTPRSRRVLAPEGALFFGHPERVADKIVALTRTLGLQRFEMHASHVGPRRDHALDRALRDPGGAAGGRAARGLRGTMAA